MMNSDESETKAVHSRRRMLSVIEGTIMTKKRDFII